MNQQSRVGLPHRRGSGVRAVLLVMAAVAGWQELPSGILPLLAEDSLPAGKQAKSDKLTSERGKKGAEQAGQADRFFANGTIPRLKIEISEDELEKLRADGRRYVPCVIRDGKTSYEGAGIHLKGAAGSFQGVDERPAFTVHFGKYKRGQRFQGLEKLHLNNSVQDPTVLHEKICSELFLAAGVPTPRVTHARVWLNGRDLGLYVLKEGFDRAFLARHFKEPLGTLYEGGFCADIDTELKVQVGDPARNREELRGLVEAAREADPVLRQKKIAERLDVEKFLTFMALELMTGHWDGYCSNRNNYRVYHDPKTNRHQFFPHGMDQMFAEPEADILGTPGALVSEAVMGIPEWRGRYRDRVGELLPLFSPPTKLLASIDAVHARVRPVLREIDPNLARDHDEQVRDLKSRIVARAESLRRQSATAEPRPLKFDEQGVARVVHWTPQKETEDAELSEQTDPKRVRWLAISCGPGGECVASWRSRVVLPAGKYRLVGVVRTAGVEPLEHPVGSGAGLRISGSQRDNSAVGNRGPREVEYPFEVGEGAREVTLVAELRATRGHAWFAADSLRLVREK